MPTEQENFMAQALALAAEAAAAGEVPVGCVIVRDGEIVGRGRNRREEKQATASHAEMEAIAQALPFLRASTRGRPSPLSRQALRQCRPRGPRSGIGRQSAPGPESLCICTAAPHFTPVLFLLPVGAVVVHRAHGLSFVNLINLAVFHQPRPPRTVKADEVPVRRVIVRGPDDFYPARLEPEFFANLNSRGFFGDLF